MTTPTPLTPRCEQLLNLVVAMLTRIRAGSSAWYTPGEVARDWKGYEEVSSFPFYGVIEGPLRPITDGTHDGGALLEQTLTIVVWVNEDKIAWGLEPKNRRVALLRACADLVTALTSAWHAGPDWIIGMHHPSITTDEAAMVAKPYAYAEVSVTIQYWAALGQI